MPRVCVVYGCIVGSRSYTGRAYTMFRLPKINTAPRMRQCWLDKINREDFVPTSESRVCAKHFEERFFKTETDRYGRVRKTQQLTKFAIPTLYMRGPGDMRDEEDVSASVNNINHDHSYQVGGVSVVDSSLPDVNVIQSEVTIGEIEDTQNESPNIPLTSCSGCVDRSILVSRIEQLERQQIREKLEFEKVTRFLKEDQVQKLSLPSTSKMQWSDDTLMDSIHLYYKIGGRAYEYLRTKKKFPLPSISTLKKHLRLVKCKPGVLYDIVPYIKSNVASMEEHERYCIINMDEMTVKVIESQMSNIS